MEELIFACIGVAGAAWGVYRDIVARRDRRRRVELEARLAEPDVDVRLDQGSVAHGLDNSIQVIVGIENKGQTMAKDVTYGLRYGERELAAGGYEAGHRVPFLSPGETDSSLVFIHLDIVQALRMRQERLTDTMVPWARFADKLGNEYEI